MNCVLFAEMDQDFSFKKPKHLKVLENGGKSTGNIREFCPEKFEPCLLGNVVPLSMEGSAGSEPSLLRGREKLVANFSDCSLARNCFVKNVLCSALIT